MKFAGFMARFFAYLIDGAAVAILATLVSWVLFGLVGLTGSTGSGLLGFLSGTLAVMTVVVLALFQFIYFGWTWSRSGQSIGMRLLNMKVVRQGSEETVGFLRGGLRGTVGYYISGLIFGLGYIWAAFDGNKEAWHDKLFNTWVVITR